MNIRYSLSRLFSSQRFICTILAIATAPSFTAAAQTSRADKDAPRPQILGVAHIGLRTDNLDASRKFYTGVLGLPEIPSKAATSATNPKPAHFKVNGKQYIELYPELTDPNQDRLIAIAFETNNAAQLRRYLAAKGVEVPDRLESQRDGTLSFHLTDPEGHLVEFVEYRRTSLPKKTSATSDNRISQRIIHVGVVVNDRAAADRFYKDILGFKEFWHGGMTDDATDWVDMRVPDGTDWLEYMLNVKDPDPRTLGVMHHFALGVPSVKAGYETVLKRGARPDEKPQIGRDGKWQLNLYDPNFTRVELMEPTPVQTPCCSPMKQ